MLQSKRLIKMSMKANIDEKYVFTDKKGHSYEISHMPFYEENYIRDAEDAIEDKYISLLTDAGVDAKSTPEINSTSIFLSLSIVQNYQDGMRLSISFESDTSGEFRHNLYQKCVEAISGKKFVQECDPSCIMKLDFSKYFKAIDPSGKYVSLFTQSQKCLDEACKSGIRREEISKFILEHLYDFESVESECEEVYYDSIERNSEYACNKCFEQFLQNAYDYVEILREIDKALPEGAVMDEFPIDEYGWLLLPIAFSGGSVIVDIPKFTVDDCIALEDYPDELKLSDELFAEGLVYVYDLSYNSILTVNGQSFDVSKQYNITDHPTLYVDNYLHYKGMTQVIEKLDSNIADIIDEMSKEYGKQMLIQYLSDASTHYGSGSGKDNARTRMIEIEAHDKKMFKKFTESNFVHELESRVNKLSEKITNDVILIDDDIPKLGYKKEYELFTEACELLDAMLLADDNDDHQIILARHRKSFGQLSRQELYTSLIETESLDRTKYKTKKLQQVVDMLNECAANGIRILPGGKPYVDVPNAEVIVKPNFKYFKAVHVNATRD